MVGAAGDRVMLVRPEIRVGIGCWATTAPLVSMEKCCLPSESYREISKLSVIR